MSYGFDASLDFSPFEDRSLSDNFLPRIAPAIIILSTSVLFGVWTLYLRPVPAHAPIQIVKAAPAAAASPGATVAAANYGGLTQPDSAASPPVLLTQNFPLQANLEASLEPDPLAPAAPVGAPDSLAEMPAAPETGEAAPDTAPMPVPRPADLGTPARPNPFQAQSRRLAQQTPSAAPAPADNRSIFDKLLGLVHPSGPGKQVLAYANPEDGAVGNAPSPVPNLMPRFAPAAPVHADGGTAIYDISAHTVYMPDGRRLEAHSGLGELKDDPRYVSERMRGATPPSTYDLSLREQLFHGVQALRLTPVGGGVYGRAGLLAHRYMLGPNGDSNGCVSFKDYNAFLQAYESGQVKRLVVVAHGG